MCVWICMFVFVYTAVHIMRMYGLSMCVDDLYICVCVWVVDVCWWFVLMICIFVFVYELSMCVGCKRIKFNCKWPNYSSIEMYMSISIYGIQKRHLHCLTILTFCDHSRPQQKSDTQMTEKKKWIKNFLIVYSMFALNGDVPFAATDVRSDDWNHPRCWSVPFMVRDQKWNIKNKTLKEIIIKYYDVCVYLCENVVCVCICVKMLYMCVYVHVHACVCICACACVCVYMCALCVCMCRQWNYTTFNVHVSFLVPSRSKII